MNKNSKIALGLLMAMAAPALTSCGSGSDIESKVSLVPVTVSKDKWSFVDPDGNVLFEDEFKNCPTLVYNGVFSMMEKDDYAVYKVNGDKYDLLGELDGLKDAGYMEDGLIPVTFPRQRITVYDESGSKKFELAPVGDQEVTWSAAGYSDGLLLFGTEEGKQGYFGKDGKVAIKPAYDEASAFGQGLAVVGKKAESDGMMLYSVIDKKGEVIFKLRQGQRPRVNSNMPAYSNGYMIVSEDDRDVLYDTGGEMIKFPSKISHIWETDGTYVIFTNSEYEAGVAKLDGEIVVRPKYGSIAFDGKDGFVAMKDDECVMLDKEGKEVKRLDFNRVVPFGKFGYFAYDGSRWSLIDKEGKEKGKEDFYSISDNERSYSSQVFTDYFDIKAVAKKLVDLIGTAGVGDFRFGSTASSILSGESPKDYSYSNNINFSGLSREGFRYEINGRGFFSAPIAISDWDSSSYSYTYFWNSNSKLCGVNLALETSSDWGKQGFDAIMAELKARGFKIDKQGYVYGENPSALLSNGNIAVWTACENDGHNATVTIVDLQSEVGKEAFDEFKRQITTDKNGTPEPEEVAVEEVVDEEMATPAEAPAEAAAQ